MQKRFVLVCESSLCPIKLTDVSGPDLGEAGRYSRPEQLTVISIVGFSGSGKTTLAAALFGCPDVVRQFPCRAWVVASEHRGNSKGFLTALLEKLLPGDSAIGSLHQVQDDITNYLNDKRCVFFTTPIC